MNPRRARSKWANWSRKGAQQAPKKASASPKKRHWGWRIVAVILVIWVSGSFVPDRRRPVVVPLTQQVARFDAKPVKNTRNIATVKRLTEAERRDIFRQMDEAEDRAHAEADAAIPADDKATASMDEDTLRATLDANTALAHKLMEMYKSEVDKEFLLSKKERETIENEGVLKRWPPL